MKAPPRLTLPAALTAAVLAFTTMSPAAATEQATTTTLSAEQHGDLVSKVVRSGGEIVSTLVDATTGEAVLPDPALAGTRPTDGGPSGGAVLGQWAKPDGHFGRLAETSARTASELDGGSGDEPATDDGLAGAASAEPDASAATWAPAGIKGTDVSNWQTSISWTSLWNQGSRFAYVKASEGDSIRNSLFNQQYTGAGAVGMYRGAYHFAIPTRDSSGATQADYFINNGGGWSADGKTLPGLLDVENNPYPSLYGDQCYDFTQAEMVKWIRDFSDRYKARTGRLPAIYTNAYWWQDCTGSSSAFNDHPLHIAAYGVSAPLVYPNGWSTYDLWQYTDAGFQEKIDANVYRGTSSQLLDLVRNPYYKPIGGRATSGSEITLTPSAEFAVKGGIGNQYRALGGSAVFGNPTMDERGGLVDGGVYQSFSKNSTFYWNASTGAWPVNFSGAIGRKFVAGRYENGLGYPTTQERALPGGAYQVFRSGGTVNKVLWSSATGAKAVKENSAIGQRWKASGYERGYGYPSTDEFGGLVNGGAFQVFRNGNDFYKVLWSPATGAHAVKENSAIGREWKAGGYERGYGYPATGEYPYGNEVRQRFSKGFTVHYSTVTKQTWVTR